MPNTRRRLAFWSLIILSLASVVAGAVIAIGKTATLERTITDGTATGVDVYGGQAWVTLGAGLVTAGVIGIFIALAAIVLSPVREADEAEAPALLVDEIADTESDEIVAQAPATAAQADAEQLETGARS